MNRSGFWTFLLLLSVQALVFAGKDYYEILQVPKGASESQVKRSYRKLALQYHPDKVSGTAAQKEAAAKKFAEINNAYEALSDPEKRKVYDRHGEDGLKQQQQQGQRGGGGNDIFDMFFGGGNRREEEEQTKRGHDVYVDLYVTLADVYVGKEFVVVRDKVVVKPAPGKRKCKCKNKMSTRQIGPGMFQQYTTQVCEDCPNVKYEREQTSVTVHLEPGMPNGHHISFFEEGEPIVDGEPGDLKFVVRTVLDKRFERRTNDLMLNMTISLADALAGFTQEIVHLDGHIVTLRSTDIVRPGDYQMIKGEGMPHYQDDLKKGDLWILFTVQFPAALTDAAKASLRALLPV